MKRLKPAWCVAAALALFFPAGTFGALDGASERLRAEASWMDGIGKPSRGAAVQPAAQESLEKGPAIPPERSLQPPRPRKVRGFSGFDMGFVKAGGVVAGPVCDMASSYGDSDGSRKVAGYLLLLPALVIGFAVGLLGGLWGATVGIAPREWSFKI